MQQTVGETRGKIIRRLRRDKKWSQAQLAKKSGLSVPTISLLETDKIVSPHPKTMENLAKVLPIPENLISVFIDDGDNAGNTEKDVVKQSGVVENNLVSSDTQHFPIGIPFGNSHVDISPSNKREILNLLFWSYSTGILQLEDIDAVIKKTQR